LQSKLLKGELDLLALHQAQPTRYPFLLESVAKSSQNHYSLLFAFPQQTLSLNHLTEPSFVQQFDQYWQQAGVDDKAQQHLPFRGGWFVYLGYELAGQLEPSLQLPPSSTALPIAVAVRIPAVIIVDHQAKTTTFIAEADFADYLPIMWADSQALPRLPLNSQALRLNLQEDLPELFLNGVQQIREYIAAGDVFQVNLSRTWQGELQSTHSAVDLYQRLRQANPAPFACLAQFPAFSIISSSPERLVRVEQNVIETRPIAGTRPRGQDAANDQALLQELISHPKERAEHIMLIDLERNDLGRVCEYGSVKVDELMVIESYQHVHHIVSNVRGHLKAGMTPGQVIRAVFPGGTITGCPKVRCMEIIAELEQVRREAYTGSVGYINHNGDMDFNILIRTMSLQGQQLNFRTGAGIVIDSIAENELRETRHKARGLLRALGYDAA
jgi:anthranilate synthase component 1